MKARLVAVVASAAVLGAASIAVEASGRPAQPVGSSARAGSATTVPAAAWVPSITLPRGFAPVAHYAQLVKSYDFDGLTLPDDWSVGSNENYGYQATQFEPSQVSLTGSSVALTAIRQSGALRLPYTSGWISTQNRFTLTYGMVDFRAKMPAGQGLWSALWLDQVNGSDPWGEIDVQEMLLSNTHAVNASLHGWAPPPAWVETQTTWLAADASQGFHDYQVVWQPGMITWAIDGVAYAQYTRAQARAAGHPWPFDDGSGFYLIADLAVGAGDEWGGAPGAATVFPAAMQVQSVRVWQ